MLWKCQQKRMINAGVSVDSSQHFSFPVALFQLKCVFYFLIIFWEGLGLVFEFSFNTADNEGCLCSQRY